MAIFALVASLAFVSCSQEQVAESTLTINIDSSLSRGIESISMDVSKFHVIVSDTDGSTVVDETVDSTTTKVSAKINVGTYTVTVEALNKEGTVIGSGSQDVVLRIGQNNSVTISVKELEGEGTFSVDLTAPAGFNLKLEVLNVKDEVVASVDLAAEDTKYTAEQTLSNGFYLFKIISTSGEESKVLKRDSARIVKGQICKYSATISSSVNGEVVFSNEIVGTPKIEITVNRYALKTDKVLKASATISNISDYTCYWCVDGQVIGQAGEYADLNMDFSSYDEGEHSVSLFVNNGTVIWSETVEISDTSLDGYYVGSRPYNNYYYFFEIENGKIKYTYYEGSLVEFDAVEYTTEEVDGGILVIYQAADYRDYPFAILIPSDSEATSTTLYYEYGEDENGESQNRSVGINWEESENPVDWTDGTPVATSETYHTSTVTSKYGTFTTNERNNHTFDENGICTECGYDQNSNMFGIRDDAEYVTESSGRIFLCRYWPGDFTLADGTVVNDSSKFYVKRVSGWSGNYYMLYFPAAIYDKYVELGGTGSSSSAFSWYIGIYHSELSDKNYYNLSNAHEFVQSLMEAGVQTITETEISSSRRTVYSDCSILPENLESYMFSRYNENGIQDENENAITSLDHIYFTYNENSNMATIYYPSIIDEMYERIDGINANSGNPFWRYIHIYYPDLDTSEDNSYNMVKTLVESEFIEPVLEDYLDYGV